MAKRRKPEDGEGAAKAAPSESGMLRKMLDAAIAEQDAILAADPGRSIADPTLPVFQLHAQVKLHRCMQRLAAGDGFAMMLALRLCANHDLPMPAWLASAYIERFDRVLNYQANSWDEVFGSPIPKGKHLAALQKKRALQPKLFLMTKELMAKGLAVEEAIRVSGEKLGLGRALAWEYYTGYRGSIGDPEFRADRAVALATTPENFNTSRSDESEE